MAKRGDAKLNEPQSLEKFGMVLHPKIGDSFWVVHTILVHSFWSEYSSQSLTRAKRSGGQDHLMCLSRNYLRDPFPGFNLVKTKTKETTLLTEARVVSVGEDGEAESASHAGVHLDELPLAFEVLTQHQTRGLSHHGVTDSEEDPVAKNK